MKALHLASLALLALVAAPAGAQRIECESREYQYNFCATPEGVASARLVQQRSRSPCIEGRSWGWDRRGIWVSNGCEGTFDYQAFRSARPAGPGPGGARIVSCESRDYRQEFCPVDDVDHVTLARQRSRAPCVLNQTWGWRANGIWVSGGCEADFEVVSDRRRGGPPRATGHVVCESDNYRYNFCATGRLRDAQLVDQRSQAACIRGRSWGVEREGIWVDDGCEGEFRILR